MNNTCVRCGDVIPEGMQVCPTCLKSAVGLDCTCYHVITAPRYDHTCGMLINHSHGVCWGTKERDECLCGGDPAKCDFYPEKREKYKGVSETMSDKTVDIQAYIKRKLKLLYQLCIWLNNEQLEHLLSLKTEIAVDNYAHSLIVGKEDE